MKSMQYVLMLFLSIISAFLGGVVGVWFLMPQSVLAQDEPQKVIEAERFQVVDSGGKVQSYFGLRSDDKSGIISMSGPSPLLTLSGQESTRLHLGVIEGQSLLIYTDENGKGRVQIGTTANGDPLLKLMNAKGDDIFGFLGEENDPFFILKGDFMFFNGEFQLEDSTIILHDNSGNELELGTTSLTLFDEEGKVVWSVP